MTILNVGAMTMMMLLAGAPAERPTIVVRAPDSPVRLDRATILSGAEGPPVLLYSATNLTDQELEQFTVMAFVFAADGHLKAKQLAPGRRTLNGRETKYSTMVLDGSPIEATDIIVVGVNQAQRAGSDNWWRVDLSAGSGRRRSAKEALTPLPTKG